LQLLLTPAGRNDSSDNASALDLAQVAAALQMAPDQLWSRLQPRDSDDDDADTGDNHVDCYQLAKDLLADMAQSNPGTVLWDPSKLMGSSNKQKVGLLPAVPADLKQVPTRIFGKEVDSDAAVPITATTMAASSSSLDPPVSVQDIASQKMGMAAPSTVVVAAWVQNRRRYQDSVTVLGVVDEFAAVLGGQESDNDNDTDRKDAYNNDAERPRLKCVLHPDVTVGNLTITSSLLATGARVLMQGIIVHSEHGIAVMPTLWVTNVRLLRSSWRPRAVRHLLELVYDGQVAIDEAAGALELEQAVADEIAGLDELTKRQWMAAVISRNLQNANSRVGIVSPQMQAALNHYASLREDFPLNQTCIRNGVEQGISEEDASAGQASALWTSTPGSRWQRTKRPQLEWMIAQIEDVIKSHPDYGKRRLQVVDVGGGKGYLANLVAEQLSDVVDVRVVDISARAINNGMMRARRRNLENIEYNVGDATAVDMVGVDIVVALHACGALSDVAMGHAVANGAAFVVCPCCFRSNPHLRVRLPVQKQLVTVSEWLKTDHQDVEALQQLAEVQGDIHMAGQAIHTICALRAAASKHHYDSSTTSPNDNDLTVEIKTFPISFSTRNFCIVGTVQQKM
jgi:2-polyprenyl-3-methyl-5-hydroxy-6-metoxy-1,4-benzoquinol methylase